MRASTLLGLVGGCCFVIGSLCFLDDDLYRMGVWWFVAGSVAMVGDAALRVREDRTTRTSSPPGSVGGLDGGGPGRGVAEEGG